MLIDRYQIDTDTVLGKGGFGSVFHAHDVHTGEAVATKTIAVRRSSSRERVLAEVRLMERVSSHAGCIRLCGAREVPDHFSKPYIFIFMELAAQGELLGRVMRDGFLEEDVARRYFGQIADAVHFLHQQGIAHRDLKLENVLLTADDTCKLCDFGLAFEYEVDPATGAVDASTPLFEVCGSKSYVAPEVLAERGYHGLRADCWSLGVCLFGMVSGFFPFQEARLDDWRYAKATSVATAGGSLVRCVYALYERDCLLSPELLAIVDGLLTAAPAWRHTARDAVEAAWARGCELDHEPAAKAPRRTPPCSPASPRSIIPCDDACDDDDGFASPATVRGDLLSMCSFVSPEPSCSLDAELLFGSDSSEEL